MQKRQKSIRGVAKSEGCVVAQKVKKDHVLLMFFESLKTRKTRLRENRPQTHPFKAEKVTLLKISRF